MAKVFRKFGLGLTVALVLSATSEQVFARDDNVTSTARALALEGEADFKEGRFEQAGEKFLKAYYAVQVPTLGRSAARALVKQGKFVAASELYRQVARLQSNELWVGAVQQEAQGKSAEELEALLPRLARLRIVIQDSPCSNVRVTIDGAPVPNSLLGVEHLVDPGKRNVLAQCAEAHAEQSIRLAESETRQAVLLFVNSANRAANGSAKSSEAVHNSPETKTDPARTVGWLGVGLGAAGLAVGTTFGIIVASKSNLRASCPDDRCNSSVSQSTMDSYNTARTVTTIGLVVGSVGLAAGFTLLLTHPSNEKPSVEAWVGPSSVGIKGAF